MVAVVNLGAISAEFNSLPWAPLLATLIMFLLASRVWNLLPSRRRSPIPA